MGLTPRLMWTVLSCTLGASFQYGFHVGFVNNAASYVRQHFEALGVEPQGDDEHFTYIWSLVVSAFALGGCAGTFALPPVANRIGRKRALLLTAIPCYLSCALIGMGPNWTYLMLGRLLVGFGCGGGLSVVSIYISEISPVALRGGLGTSSQLLITIGICIAQGVSTSQFDLLAGQETWQYMLLIPTTCCCILVLGLPACADSPSWLLGSRGEAAAEEALRWFRTDASEEEIAAEMQVMRDEAAMGGGKTAGVSEILRDPLLWKPIVVGMFVNLSMQMSGIDAVLFYSTMVFEKAGIGVLDAQVWTTAVGLVNVLVTIPAMLFMDKAGRKAFQSVGLGGMCCAYAVITFAMVTGRHMLAVYSMVTIIIFFAFGPGCIGWFIVAELTPIHARSFGTALGLGANWIANWFVGFIFPHILIALGDWCFTVFMGTTFVLCVFTLVCVPETKGKTITEVSKFFAPDRMLDKNHMLDTALLG